MLRRGVTNEEAVGRLLQKIIMDMKHSHKGNEASFQAIAMMFAF